MQDQYGSLKGTVNPRECELASLASVRAFAQAWLDSGRPIDTLCLNAGAQFVGEKEPRRTEDGFELTVGVNHLGHFLLCNLLLPALQASENGPRIVVTASEVLFHVSIELIHSQTLTSSCCVHSCMLHEMKQVRQSVDKYSGA
jgi:NAD(P)-dependent dehydrogenase (short-subunit alcohol dehydrogenase family)